MGASEPTDRPTDRPIQDAEVRRLAGMLSKMDEDALKQRKEYDQVRPADACCTCLHIIVGTNHTNRQGRKKLLPQTRCR